MKFRVTRARYNPENKHAHVELRAPDGGSEVIAAVMFSLSPGAGRSTKQIEQDMLAKARHLLTAAGAADV